MNACGRATSTPDSPTRYIPGYFALSSPKPTHSIELRWLLDGSTRPNRTPPSTPNTCSGSHPVHPTGKKSTSKPPFITSLSLFNHENINPKDDCPSLPLVEHANRIEIHRRQKRVESELSEALKGDIEWVRSGGVLRDSNGRRDFTRTHKIREQLNEQERERKALAGWTEYEDRWRASLLANGGRRKGSSAESTGDGVQGIGFADVAWPVAKPPEDSEGLTVGAVRDFVLAPLRVRGITASKRKDRIRQLLLRYHPDKTAFLLSRVREEEKDQVCEGINNVFMSLKSLQEDPELRDMK